MDPNEIIKQQREEIELLKNYAHTCELEFEQLLDVTEECCAAKTMESACAIFKVFKENTSFKKTAESFASLKKRIAELEQRNAELESELKQLIDCATCEALLPSSAFGGTRQLVDDIHKDATDVGGCYEISTGLIDMLFESYTDAGACKLLSKFAIEQKIEAFENAEIPRHAKSGCIGEFNFVIKDGNCCPQCWVEQDDNCDLCHGQTDENGCSDQVVTVPWNICKDIWLAMNKIKADELHKGAE